MSVCLTDETRKARKDHRCYLCNFKIHKGEVYRYWSGVHPGEGYWSSKAHQSCRAKTNKWDWEDWENHVWDYFRDLLSAGEIEFRKLMEAGE